LARLPTRGAGVGKKAEEKWGKEEGSLLTKKEKEKDQGGNKTVPPLSQTIPEGRKPPKKSKSTTKGGLT